MENQQVEIAVLKTQVESLIEKQKELTARVRANERVVAIVSAIGIGAGGIVGTTVLNVPPAEAKPTAGELIQDMRDWKAKQNREPVDVSINNALKDLEIEDGCNETPEQKILLQFSGNEDQKSFRWGYHRCGDRLRIRSSEDGKSEDCWSRHSREENEEFGGKGTWVRCDQLVEGQTHSDNKR